MRPPILAVSLTFLLAAVVCPAGIIVQGSLTHEYSVEPGRLYEGVIEITNADDHPQPTRIYQTDYTFTADGITQYGEPGKLARSNAGWIAYAPREIEIPAQQTVSIRYTVQVPADATLRGTYWSVIMVEPSSEGTGGSEEATQQVRVGLRQVIRYAIQVVTHVGTEGSRDLTFGAMRLGVEDGKRILAVDMENTGERWLRVSFWTELYGSDGNLVGHFDGTQQRLYPGTSARFVAELGGVAAGTYRALIVADCGGDDVFGATLNLVLR